MDLSSFDRRQCLQECRETSYFYNQETYELLPDDFKIESSYEGNPLKELFSKLEAVLSICYLASNATVQNAGVNLQVIGQHSVEYAYRFSKMCENTANMSRP